jgi:putative ABC transport system ATP-binding protein
MRLTVTDTLAIETQSLTKVYGSGHTEVVAMREASLSVGRAQCVALIGPSGAGKSTFLTAVGLINPPTSGRITIGGRLVMDGPRALTNPTAFRRRHIGYVSQKTNLVRFLTARENVQIALELNGEPPRAARRRALELLEYLGVGERAAGYPPELSGGEQQRVAVARALANRPSVLLADEPTAALDSRLGRQVMELFRKVAHEQGAGVIVVTHDQRALDVFDVIYEMEDGVIQRGAGGTTETTLAAPLAGGSGSM